MEENPVFNLEQFERTIVLLKQYGTAQRTKDDRAVRLKNKSFQVFGGEISQKVPDMAPIENSVDVGKAVVNLLSTVPGVDTKGIIDEASKPNSIAISDQALSISLRKREASEVGMYLTFPTKFPIPDNEYFTLRFEREDEKTRISVKIKMDSGCFPRNGEIEVAEKEKHNWGTTTKSRHTAKFGQDSVITEGSIDLNLPKGEELNIVKLISAITSPDNLDSPVDPNSIIQKARPKLLSSQSSQSRDF